MRTGGHQTINKSGTQDRSRDEAQERIKKLEAQIKLELQEKKKRQELEKQRYEALTKRVDAAVQKRDHEELQKRNFEELQKKNLEEMAKMQEQKNFVPIRSSKLRIVAIILLTLLSMAFLVGMAGFVFVFSIIKDAPAIDTGNIKALLSENSVIYDDKGYVLDNVFFESRRTNVTYASLPENLKNAFIAVEDKTFWEHRGFNITRIVGAAVEAFRSGDRVRGTSTITQQLARNLYLMETRTEYSLYRKIIEAYYALLLEKDLTKEEILEAYLNRIYLGFGASGVQAASQAYFAKDVEELTLTESVALAAIIQEPNAFSLIRTLPNASVSEDNENILYRDSTFAYLSNVQASERRRHLILGLMQEQGYITRSEYRRAKSEDLRDNLRPFVPGETQNTSYFIDFVTRQVVDDLALELDITESMAWGMLFNGGLRIHTTLDAPLQSIIEREFSDNSNFPLTTNFSRDRAGNILRPAGGILLYSYNNYFDAEGTFVIAPDEYSRLDNGDILLHRGKRLNFFRTESNGVLDYTVNFRGMYIRENGVFSTISEGVIMIPAEYKYRDTDGNLIIESRFFRDHPGFFTETQQGLAVLPANYRLNQRVVQPQAAMVIMDYETGHIKAMEGGRNIEGRLLFNRSANPRQPGSAIKPTSVYGAALQTAADEIAGVRMYSPMPSTPFTPAISFSGSYWTAASVINDSPLFLDDRPWPRNFDRSHRGAMSVRSSLIHSVNVNAVKVSSQLGPELSVEFLKRLGVTTIVESGSVSDMNTAALALGGMTNGISPLEMAGSYSAFANEGRYNKPIAYTKVTNRNGEILLENIPKNIQVMDPGVAFIMTDILRSTVSDGFARRASVSGRVVAGKTGTTSDNYDAWFVGMSSGYTASLWIGNDVNLELSEGSLSAARLWSRIMTQALDGKPNKSFPERPANVIRADGEYFIAGTQGSPFRDISSWEDELPEDDTEENEFAEEGENGIDGIDDIDENGGAGGEVDLTGPEGVSRPEEMYNPFTHQQEEGGY